MTKTVITSAINATCPKCGTNIIIAEVSEATTNKRTRHMKAEAKLEVLRNAGVNVANLFSMKGADGHETIARLENGQLSVVPDDDPIFNVIIGAGTVPNSQLFRRWVMSQVFHMLIWRGYRGDQGFVAALRMKGYKYQWKMVLEELRVQAKLAEEDVENFGLRHRWFDRENVALMCEDYIKQLDTHIKELKVRHCKGIPYVKIKSTNVFTSDLNSKVFNPLRQAVRHVRDSKTPLALYHNVGEFISLATKWWLTYDGKMPQVFIDAYKGAGAYFTMKNLILFHGATFKNGCVKIAQQKSLKLLEEKAAEYAGQGWRLFGLMKKLISDSNIDIEKKMAEWHK